MRTIYLALAAWLGLLATSSHAAIVTVTPVATAVLEPADFSFVDPSYIVAPGQLLPRAEPYLIQVDVTMRISDLLPGQVGFSNTAFNVNLSGDGVPYSDELLGINAWLGDMGSGLPCNPPEPFCGIGLWEFNEDAGRNKNDLQGVLLVGYTHGFGPIGSDPRRTLGQGPDGQHAGSFYVLIPGTPGASTAATLATRWGASTYDETGFSTTDNNTAIGGATGMIRVVPEPGTVLLMLIAFPLLALKLRR